MNVTFPSRPETQNTSCGTTAGPEPSSAPQAAAACNQSVAAWHCKTRLCQTMAHACKEFMAEYVGICADLCVCDRTCGAVYIYGCASLGLVPHRATDQAAAALSGAGCAHAGVVCACICMRAQALTSTAGRCHVLYSIVASVEWHDIIYDMMRAPGQYNKAHVLTRPSITYQGYFWLQAGMAAETVSGADARLDLADVTLSDDSFDDSGSDDFDEKDNSTDCFLRNLEKQKQLDHAALLASVKALRASVEAGLASVSKAITALLRLAEKSDTQHESTRSELAATRSEVAATSERVAVLKVQAEQKRRVVLLGQLAFTVDWAAGVAILGPEQTGFTTVKDLFKRYNGYNSCPTLTGQQRMQYTRFERFLALHSFSMEDAVALTRVVRGGYPFTTEEAARTTSVQLASWAVDAGMGRDDAQKLIELSALFAQHADRPLHKKDAQRLREEIGAVYMCVYACMCGLAAQLLLAHWGTWYQSIRKA